MNAVHDKSKSFELYESLLEAPSMKEMKEMYMMKYNKYVSFMKRNADQISKMFARALPKDDSKCNSISSGTNNVANIYFTLIADSPEQKKA